MLPSSWIQNVSVTTSAGVVEAKVRVYVQPGGTGTAGIGILNIPLIPTPAEWEVVVKMPKESLATS